jgi:hypothetical protein
MYRSTARRCLTALAVAIFLATPLAAQAANLPRTHITLTSAIAVDAVAGTATLPLFHGTVNGKSVWYIVTDSSNPADAKKRGVNAAPLLASLDADAVQAAHTTPNGLAFDGAPDFSPARVYDPSSTGFPPTKAAPGAIADAAYSPFVRIDGSSTVINAPIVATGDGPFDVTTHTNTQDRVIAIDTAKKTATFLLARGFANSKAVLYLSTEASVDGPAAIERATYVPRLAKRDRGSVPIFVIANGTNQGLGYTALHGLDRDATLANAQSLRSPLNVLATFPLGPAAAAYSPLWSANIGAWAPNAHQHVLTSTAAFAVEADAKHITAPDGKSPLGPTGIFVNCPVVAYVDAAP